MISKGEFFYHAEDVYSPAAQRDGTVTAKFRRVAGDKVEIITRDSTDNNSVIITMTNQEFEAMIKTYKESE